MEGGVGVRAAGSDVVNGVAIDVGRMRCAGACEGAILG